MNGELSNCRSLYRPLEDQIGNTGTQVEEGRISAEICVQILPYFDIFLTLNKRTQTQ